MKERRNTYLFERSFTGAETIDDIDRYPDDGGTTDGPAQDGDPERLLGGVRIFFTRLKRTHEQNLLKQTFIYYRGFFIFI